MTTINQHLNICVPCLHMPWLERHNLRCYSYECTFMDIKFLAVPFYPAYKLCRWLLSHGWAITFQWVSLCHHKGKGFSAHIVHLYISRQHSMLYLRLGRYFPCTKRDGTFTPEVPMCCYPVVNILLILIHTVQHSI